MKSILRLTLLLLSTSSSMFSQTADDYVNQGRAHLTAQNIAAANGSFSNAVAMSSNHPAANVFYAATRLLVLPSQPAGSNFLNRLGLPTTGRDIYNWTAELPTDANGVPIAPLGMSASDFTALFRTNLLPALIAAEVNLAKVTNTNFTLTLNSSETLSTEVTLDYGDILLLRALLRAGEYFAYTAYSWDLNVQLSVIRSFYVANELPTAHKMLHDYPSLFTFATTNDLNAAKFAFQTGASLYIEASRLIRDRSTNITRLFNYDASQSAVEADFRMTLTDFTNSLLTAVPLTLSTNYTTFLADHSLDTNYSVFLGSHFSGVHTLRSFLPQFQDYGFGLGTLPDASFGGLIDGITSEQMDEVLGENLFPIPIIAAGAKNGSGQFQLLLRVATNHGYAVQISTNLTDWNDYATFLATTNLYTFVDTSAATSYQRYYRIVDRYTVLTLRPLERIRHSGAENSQYNFVVTGRSSLVIRTSRGTGDCDIYVKFGSPPTLTDWDYRPYLHGNEEYVSAFSAQPGNWYIMLHGYKSYSRVKLYAY